MRRIISLVLVTLPLSSMVAANELVLTAPPRESEAKSKEVFEPIAQYLTRALGQTVVFKYSDNWLTYQSEMQKDKYDIVFDGPHFVSWRMDRIKHVPVVKLPSELSYVIVARKDNAQINSVVDLNGRQFCAPSPPNLGALTALYEFTNPARQPALKNTKGFPQAYEGMISGQCVAAVLQIKQFEKLDKEKQLAKVLFQSKGLPNQAFSASSRISDEMRVRLSTALLSDEGKKATLKLRQEYNGQDFELATVAEYQGHSVLLKDTWGFSH